MTRDARALAVALLLALSPLVAGPSAAQEPPGRALPVRGLCIAAPRPDRVDEFARFIGEELAPRSVNTLVLRVDDNYRYTSRPELGDPEGLSKGDVSKIAAACRRAGIRVIPQVNLLGHQSWASKTGRLLAAHPEFDETPWVAMPARFAWPNPDRLYCKSYCPRHPEVHGVVFDAVDEICDAFGADAFHAGLDEVFYLGEEKCPRCSGRDRAGLFADEVKAIRDHLAARGRKLWIWGDRLLDGKATGLGEWEASTNGTDRAVDLIPKDIVVCDWHYEKAATTPAYFASKGLPVVACPWKKPEVAVGQLRDILKGREGPAADARLLGVMQTVWSGADSFLDEFQGKERPPSAKARKAGESESACFRALFSEIEALKAR